MAQPVRVTILGNEYPLRSNDEALTKELAAEVDGQLRELQAKLPAQSTTTLAVLTSLNFAEQEAQSMARSCHEIERSASEVEMLCKVLEQALDA